MICHKIPYETRGEANKVARIIQQMVRGKTHPYICPDCAKFHLTSKDQKRRPVIGKEVSNG